MNSRLSVLQSITKDFIQRQGPDLLAKVLPPKVEHVILLHMAPVQSRAYQEYIKVGHLWLAAACCMWSLCIFLACLGWDEGGHLWHQMVRSWSLPAGCLKLHFACTWCVPVKAGQNRV